MGSHKIIYAIIVSLTKQVPLYAQVSFDTFGNELDLFGVCFGSFVT